MKCRCEHPVCIFNPHLKYLFSVKCGALYIKGQVIDITHHSDNSFYNFPWRMFYAWKAEVTEDTVDDYLLYDGDDNSYPIFIYVPCGKCRLCRESKVNDWITRAICESSASNYPPLFITLTYDRQHLPVDGVNKNDVQLFLKRLRRRVDYHLGKKDGLRYFLCAEYGKKTHRAHYHLLLWNMPFVSMYEGETNSFYALWSFIRDAWQNGNVRVERCRDNSGRYCFKYMRKTCVVPEGKNDTFFLYSRRPGLGFFWLQQNANDYINDSSAQSLSILDDGKVTERPIPSYFKRKLWPTVCQMFPQKVSNAVRDFMEEAAKSFCLHSRLYPDSDRPVRIINMVQDICSKYGDIFPIDFDSCVPARFWSNQVVRYINIRDAHMKEIPVHDYRHIVEYRDTVCEFNPDTGELTSLSFPLMRKYVSEDCDREVIWTKSVSTLDTFECCTLRQQFIQSWSLLNRSYKIAMAHEFDHEAVISQIIRTATHKSDVHALNSSKEDPDIAALIHQYEVDRKWERTHWTEDCV